MKKDKVINEVKLLAPMSMGEFKAWLEGFSESFVKGSPNKAQWERIQKRLNAVNVQQEVIYRDRPAWWPTWYTYTGLSPVIGSAGELPRTAITWNSNSGDDVNKFTVSNGALDNKVESIYLAATQIGKTEALEFVA